MKYVIYIGVFFMPDENAAAQRANAFCRLIKKCGYLPVIIGMKKGKVEKNILDTRNENEECVFYSLKYPASSIEWFRMLYNIDNLIKVIKHLEIQNIKAIIAMDYFAVALIKLIQYCNKNNIKFIVDTVDWFTKSQYSFPKSLIKDLDTIVRMKIVYKKCEYMITISEFLYDYYTRYVRNIVQIPGIIEPKMKNICGGNKYHGNTILKFAFVGSPGDKCEKEKIDWLIRIICEINQKEKRCEFIIAGIDRNTLAINRKDLISIKGFDDCITCLGRISHNECIQLISSSDFSVIVREDNLLSKAGFPTKLGESFLCGTPVLVTPTSNIKDFIPNEYGVISRECSYTSLKSAVEEILKMDKKDIKRMHEVVKNSNPLNCDIFLKQMKQILE